MESASQGRHCATAATHDCLLQRRRPEEKAPQRSSLATRLLRGVKRPPAGVYSQQQPRPSCPHYHDLLAQQGRTDTLSPCPAVALHLAMLDAGLACLPTCVPVCGG
jgi:hypothetical protein